MFGSPKGQIKVGSFRISLYAESSRGIWLFVHAAEDVLWGGGLWAGVSVCIYRANPLSLHCFSLSPGRMHNEFVTKSCLSDEILMK